ncbi:MAG TPA: Hpt domain-containing protein, partial [Aggregatilineales bacterium]|nr:Hpt domain-containing protein [Aggregatilineales bacterium]
MPDDGYDALMQELLQMFAVEAAEHIQTLNQTLLKLERQPDSNEKQELLNAAFRAAHSLKGSARAVELMDIEGVSHDAEAVLSAVRAGKMEINPDMVDVLLSATDLIQNLVDGQQLEAGQMDAVRQKLKTIAEGGTPQNALAESKPVASESTKPAEAKPALESPGKPAEVKSPQKPPTITIEQSAGDSSLDVLMQELLQMFAVEAVEHLTTLSQSLMALEKDLPEERHKTELNAAFRAAHSLKGSARALELMEIEGVSHEAEAVLSAVRSGSLHMNSDIVDVLLDATDIISNLVGGEAVSEDQLNDIKTRLKDAEQGKLASKAAPPPESTPPPVKPPEAPSLPAPVKTEAAPKQTPTALAEWQAALDKKETKSKPAIKPSPLSTGATEETIRVSVEKLDDLMAQAGELIVSKISADERLRELRDLRTLMSRWEKTWAETS